MSRSISTKKILFALSALIAVFIFGYFMLTGVFGSTQIALTLFSNQNLEDGLVAHWTFDEPMEDFYGIWGDGTATNTDPSGGNDYSEAIAADTAGYLYITGMCDGCGSAGGQAHYTYKVDPKDGDLIWATTTDPTTGNERGYDIVVDGERYAYVTGICNGCGDIGGTAHYTYKIDATNGDMLWATTTEFGSSFETAYGITLDDNGDVYVTGYCDGCGALAGNAMYTYKIDADDGSMVWGTSTDPTASTDEGKDILYSNGSLYLLGYCNGCGSKAGYAYYTFKLDPDTGDTLWATTTDPMNDGNSDEPFALASDGQDVYVVGACDDTCGEGGTSYTVFYTLKIDGDNGDLLWATSTNPVNALSNHEPNDAIYANNTLYVTGNCYTCGALGNNAQYILSIDPSNGDANWARALDATSGADDSTGIVYANNYLYNAARCNGCGSAGGYSHQITRLDPSDGSTAGTVANTATDRAGGNTGTVFAKSALGNIGQGVGFDGVDDYIDMGDVLDPGMSDWSYGAWVKPNHTDPDTFAGVMGKSVAAGTDERWSLFFDDDGDVIRALFDHGLTITADAPQAPYLDGAWHHLFVTIDRDGDMTLYVDGVSVDSADISAHEGEVFNRPWNFGIGAYQKNDDGTIFDRAFFDGMIDDARVYHRALSASEIKRLYQLGATTKVNTTITTNPDLENGLVLHYTFDLPDMDTASNTAEVRDRSSEGEHGDWLNHATTTIPGVIGQAIQFDGDDDYILASDNYRTHLNNNFTAAMWVNAKVSDSITGDVWGTYSGAAGDTVEVRHDIAGFLLFEFDISNFRTESGTFTFDQWNHVVFTRDTTGYAAIYINGEFSTSSDQMPSGTFSFGNNDNLQFGNGGTANERLNGALDDVRIYTRVLSDDEITRLYQLGATTKVNTTITTNPDLEQGLIGHWTFDGQDTDSSSSTGAVFDISGNDGHGDFSGNYLTQPGIHGQALSFDGNSFVEVEDPNSGTSIYDIDALTLSAWIDPASTTLSTVFQKTNVTSPYIEYGIEASNSEVWVSVQDAGNTTHQASTTISSNGLIHVLMTYDQETLDLYIDGQFVDSNTDPSGVLDHDDFNICIGIANNNDACDFTPSTYYEGVIDDIRLYNRALSAEEILRLYQLGQ